MPFRISTNGTQSPLRRYDWTMKSKNSHRRLAIALILATALAAAVLAVYISDKIREPERVRQELRLVEETFSMLPNDAIECKLTLDVAMDGSDGDLAIRTPAGWETRHIAWRNRRPPKALCEMESMKWRFLSESGVAAWDRNQLQHRRR